MPASSDFEMNVKDPDVENKSKTKKFFSGVIILTAANIIVKAVGLLFKIPLQHCIGDEGMGYFNSAYTIYTWFYMIATAGLPVAISIIVSENRAKNNGKQITRVFRTVIVLLVFIGLLTTGVMLFDASTFAAMIGAQKAYYCIIAVAPTLFFISISSAVRGYFQGFQNMVPTAVSQVLEALGKLLVGLLLAVWAKNQGYELPYVAAYAGFGITVGAAAGMFFLVLAKCLSGKEKSFELNSGSCVTENPLKKIIKIAVPITVSSSVMSLTNLIDLAVVINRLESIGYSEAAAMAVYGNYTTLVVPMFNLPPILIYPIAYSIVPVISEAMARNDKKQVRRVLSSSLRLTSVLSLPCSLGLAAMAFPILSLLYSEQSAAMGAPMLILLAPAVFLLCMLALTNAVLQAAGDVKRPVVSMVLGALSKIAVSYLLIGNENVGIYGTPIGTFACYFVAASINMYYVVKKTGVRIKISDTFVKPLIASVICCFAAVTVYGKINLFFGEATSVLAAVLSAVVVYLAVIFITGGIAEDELSLLPKNRKIISSLRKIKILK